MLLALGAPRRTVYAAWLNPPHPLVAERYRPSRSGASGEAGEHDTGGARGRPPGLGSAGPRDRAAQCRGRADRRRHRRRRTVGRPVHRLDHAYGNGEHGRRRHDTGPGPRGGHADSAEVLGLDDLGLVAAGKSADFVVLDANPLDDITNSRRISQGLSRGAEVDRAKLKARWATNRKAGKLPDTASGLRDGGTSMKRKSMVVLAAVAAVLLGRRRSRTTRSTRNSIGPSRHVERVPVTKVEWGNPTSGSSSSEDETERSELGVEGGAPMLFSAKAGEKTP